MTGSFRDDRSMPGQAPTFVDEREGLLTYLEQQRLVLRLPAHRLTDEQARVANSSSSLTVGGLIKHVASVERYWIDLVQERQPETPDDYEANFRMERAETLQGILDMYAAVARETGAVVGGIADP